MPPKKCEKLRQNSIQRGRCSISVRMVAPVVVKPDTISNAASIKDGIAPESHSGRQPATDRTIHESAVDAKPSLSCILVFPGFL